MKGERLDIYNEKLKEIENDFKIYQNNPNLEQIKKVVQKCNIFEKYNIIYLEELKKSCSKSDFEKEFEVYKDTISKEELKKHFQIEKINGMDKISMLISNLILIFQYINDENMIGLQIAVKNLLCNANEALIDYRINFQLLASDNLELYINTLYRIFYCKIFRELDGLELDNNYTEKGKEEIQKMIDDIERKKLNKSEITDEDKINLKVYKIIRNKAFSPFFSNLGLFLMNVQNSFSNRFRKATLEKEDDLLLYEKYIIFLSGYKFEDFNPDFITLWNESFNDTELSENEIKEKLKKLNKKNEDIFLKINFNYDNNGNITVKSLGNEYLISNIKKYSFSLLYKYLKHLNSSYKPIDDFALADFIKIQYFDDFIKQKIITEKWINYYNDVLQSNVIKDLLSEIYNYEIDSINLKKILSSVRFYNFATNFNGVTTDLQIYICATMDKTRGISYIDKVKFYIKTFETILHEILGHKLVHIIRHLKNKGFDPPKTIDNKLYSPHANKRKKESGECAIIKLFGERLVNSYLIGQVCFMFNIDSYKNSLSDFKSKFQEKSCKNLEPVVPPIIKDILSKDDKDSILINMFIYNSKSNDLPINLNDGTKFCFSAYMNDNLKLEKKRLLNFNNFV